MNMNDEYKVGDVFTVWGGPCQGEKGRLLEKDINGAWRYEVLHDYSDRAYLEHTRATWDFNHCNEVFIEDPNEKP